MIILHGYLLEGSGSNLWTRAIIKALCKAGHTVHLMCQESEPQLYDFISTAYKYHKSNKIQKILNRKVPYSGKCIMHKPVLGDTLPVYVKDRYDEFKNVVPMVELCDKSINEYIEFNSKVLGYIVKKYGIKSIYANHAVLMPTVAHIVGAKSNIDYMVMPHGSAIEYAVKKEERFYKYAKSAFGGAKRIFIVGEEMRERVLNLFSKDIDGLEERMEILPLGVDTAIFNLTKNKTASLNKLQQLLKIGGRGKNLIITKRFESELNEIITKLELIELISKYNQYNTKLYDSDLVSKLNSIDFEKDKIVISVGRLISNKGTHTIIAALPFILKNNPNTKIIIVGHGPLREIMETMLWALKNGHRELIENIIEWGCELEFGNEEVFEELESFFDQLKVIDMVDEYFEYARSYIKDDSVIFTGYLKHNQLKYLFGCADVALFPSLIPEAGPLVFLEAMACGVYPIGTNRGGMEEFIRIASQNMKGEDGEWMKLQPKTESIVSDMVRNIPKALDISTKYKKELHKAVEMKYDWNIVAKSLIDSIQRVKKERMTLDMAL